MGFYLTLGRFGTPVSSNGPRKQDAHVSDGVLVTGAAGFLGREVVGSLARSGRHVAGLVRVPEKEAIVRAAGGTPYVGDALDEETVARAAQGCSTFVHLASAHADDGPAAVYATKVRVEGARLLAKVAARVGGRRVVVGSGYWVYPGSPQPLNERSPVKPAGESRNNFDAENAAREEAEKTGLEVVVVRPAMVYGDGAWLRPMAEAVREGNYRLIEGGSNSWSFVSLPDTADAFRTIVASGRPGEIYNISDGAPARWSDFVGELARLLDRPMPPSLSRAEAESAYGPIIARHLMANRALEADKLKSLGWKPKFADFRAGLPPVVRSMRW